MRILLVEDHVDSAEILTVLLEANGHEVLAVGTAGDALRACAAGTFDLLVSDIGLPDFDGWELLGRVRAHCSVPAIALTAYSQPADVARSREAGFAEHLTKPVDFETLVAAVAKHEWPAP